jgi:hypothetical protein
MGSDTTNSQPSLVWITPDVVFNRAVLVSVQAEQPIARGQGKSPELRKSRATPQAAPLRDSEERSVSALTQSSFF